MIIHKERRFCWARVSLCLGLLVLPATVYGHAFGSRYDLPLPLMFYLSAAGIAVAVSFLVTFFFIRSEPEKSFQLSYAVNPKLSELLHCLLRLLGLMGLALILIAALVGDDSPTKNLATVTVWIGWWVGMVLFSALIINLWPLLNPFYTLAQWFGRLCPPQKISPLPALAPYAAVMGFLFLSWVELVSDISETPLQLFYLISIYLICTCFCARRYGIDVWFKQVDPLTRMFDVLGRAAPLAFSSSRALIVRYPGAGLLQAVETKSRVAWVCFIIALISVVLFDGVSETPVWQAVLNYFTQSQQWRPWLLALRGEGVDILALLKTLGLLVVFFMAIAAYYLLCFFMRLAVNGRVCVADIAYGFALSLLPIAIAYHLAHYISYLLLAGQLIIPILSDPFALGWDLFGTRVHRIDLSVINAEDVWWIAMTSIIVGHVISVFVAHGEAMRLFSQCNLVIRSQVPMMIFMVLLTLCSLWILAQPIVS